MTALCHKETDLSTAGCFLGFGGNKTVSPFTKLYKHTYEHNLWVIIKPHSHSLFHKT
jgi:hypothetical protein